ncbi:MAG: SDR family NAD(P)-dependent oxidoreductase [Melioribacteraceae bacterium]|nr:SDR family NAD(P)-dependent oxidoreductase [Melioribacteraceae bacterium]MCF8352876.1 SDR family NAD(P)-dependent oxidoreductase [Melioribacteraceae bacterium]MCF8393807.1 SDR family NAD(P)-dependent oxidoreductase [Melioribacteraceae bacterium]MCF8417393.1 SDR family NAD(P)-dependent oxidoreductase [Melioribacteraceae bacterium]
MKLQGKTAVVTGAAMGIGFATVKRLLNEGCYISMWDINEDNLNNAFEDLGSPENVQLLVCDVADNSQVQNCAAATKNKFGSVDILINNAGFVKGGDLDDLDNEVWEKTIDINLTSLIYTCKAFLPGMYEKNFGHIVNISSASSALGVPSLSVYTATKWAVWGFTESMRFESINKGKKGVRWSSIHPSYIKSGMFEGAKLGFLGNLIVPLLNDHDIIAKAIVVDALMKGKYSIKRPRTVRLAVLLRGILPDRIFQYLMIILGVNKSMNNWKGRK